MVGSASFEDFYRAEHPAMVRALAVAFGDRNLAEECAQVGFERAFSRWTRVSTHERPATWVYVVAVRYGWRERAREGRVGLGTTPVGDAGPDVEGAMRFEQLMRALPPRQREAVVLRFLADL